jgi:hypothetical protein
MRQISRYHLYLGCFFAPLIIFYGLSGAWQTVNLHRSTKDGSYRAPQILTSLTEVHMRQRWQPSDRADANASRREGDALLAVLPRKPFPWLSALMGIGLATTSVLGIVLAFQRTRGRRRWLTALCLAGGLLAPLSLLAS